jgi:hypothetical protein
MNLEAAIGESNPETIKKGVYGWCIPILWLV